MKYEVTPQGVCPARLEFELDGNVVHNVQFLEAERQSPGNLQTGGRSDCRSDKKQAVRDPLRIQGYILLRSAGARYRGCR